MKLNKKPFEYLDVYQEESFLWAEKVWKEIDFKKDLDNFDSEIASIALATIYNDFLHVSMEYKDNFEEYLVELYGRKGFDLKFDLMYEYREKIYNAMLAKYGENYKIYETLVIPMLVKDEYEYEEDVYISPMTDNQEIDAFTFVQNGFLY